MPIVDKSVLKSYFNDGDVPNESNYIDLIDTMGSADTVPWTGISGKPSTFPPSSHTQDWTTITGKPATFTPSAHTQDWTTITGKPATFPPSTHLHDSDYHRKDEAIINSLDGRLGGGLYVGSTATDPATGTIVSTDFMAALGGLHVGGTTDPGTDILIVDSDSKIGGGLVVGDTTINPNTGAVIYTENLSPKRGTMTHVGYVFIPLTESMTNAANWVESSRGIGTHQVDVSTFHGIVTTGSLLDAVVGGTGNIKAWQLRLLGRWTSAGSNNYAVARGRSPYTNSYGPGLAALAANINTESDGIIIADSAGDFSILIGGATAIITLQITGYYI